MISNFTAGSTEKDKVTVMILENEVLCYFNLILCYYYILKCVFS